MKDLRMSQHGKEGKLITFCGLDGCGKSTMINMLEKKLTEIGVNVIVTKQPTDNVRRWKVFRNFMDSPNHEKNEYRSLSLVAASDRIQHSNKEILPLLAEGQTVISDRYFYSCLANLRARGYRRDNWIYEIARYIPKPDLAFFLDVPAEVAISRVREREDEKDRYIDIKLQHELRKEYENICKANDGILISTENDVEDTFREIWKHVEKLYDCFENKDTEHRIFEILSAITGDEIPCDVNTELKKLSIDSLRMALLLVDLEKHFGIELDESDMDPFSLKTINDIVKLVEKYIRTSGRDGGGV